MNDTWLIIVNPNAGIRRGEKDWPKIESVLNDYNLKYEVYFTEAREHAIELTSTHLQRGFSKVIAVGGDGTFNEVANGILQAPGIHPLDITLGLITIGTGNDWGRMYEIPFDYEEAIKIILQGKIFVQDVSKVRFMNDGKPSERYMINMAGLGFDAQVAKRVNQLKEKGKGGALSYMWNIFSTLMSSQTISAQISVDHHFFPANVFSLNVGVCQYNGGGMKQLPHAVPNDGQLALTIIKKIGKLKVIRNVPRLYSGSFIKLPQVNTFLGKTIQISSDKELFMEIDGESIGHTPIEFEVVPHSIKLITPKDHS